jgi:O-antigen/teichoic acid export membrane protein
MIKSRLLNKIASFNNDSHFLEVVRGAAQALVVKVFAAGLAFGLNVFLARMLGADGVASYYLALSVVMIASVIARMGLSDTLLRYASSAISEKNWNELKLVYLRSLLIVIPLSLFSSLVLYLISDDLSLVLFDNKNVGSVMSIMALSIPFHALATMHAELLRGFKKIVAFQSILGVVLPGVSILIMLLVIPSYGVVGAAAAYTIGCAASFSFSYYLYASVLKKSEVVVGESSRSITWLDLRKSFLPNFFTNIVHQGILISLPVILVGIYANHSDAGLFAVCVRTASLIGFVVVAINSISGPKFSSLYRSGDLESLEILVHKSTAVLFVLACMITLPLFMFSEYLLFFLKMNFDGAVMVLRILLIGAVLNAAFGSVGLLLTMTGHEREQRNSTFASAVMIVILTPLLSAYYGVTGAAIASLCATVVFNVFSYFYVVKKLSISTIGWRK